MLNPFWHLSTALCLFLLATVAMANNDDWEFRLTPYVWLPSLQTDLNIGPNPPVETDTSLFDLLDAAFLGVAEARKGDWGFLGEFNYLALSADAVSPRGALGAEASLDGIMAGAAVTYRVRSDAVSTIDVFAGLRYWDLDAAIDFRRLPEVSTSRSWVDPVFGMRGQRRLPERWFVDGLAEVGGFGVGSDLQWELVAKIGYRFNETVSASLGYRHLDLDFDDEGLILDATMSGPFLAFDFQW
jgi:hypothetical protein